jgi:hypothetical protein
LRNARSSASFRYNNRSTGAEAISLHRAEQLTRHPRLLRRPLGPRCHPSPGNSAPWPTASSASSTAACATEPSTTKPRHGQ